MGVIEPLYDWRVMCIRRAKEIYPDAEFTVISQMKNFYGMKIIKPENYDVGVSPDRPIEYSDHARLKWLSENENTLYLDSDTWCKEPYKFGDNMGSAYFEAIWSGK